MQKSDAPLRLEKLAPEDLGASWLNLQPINPEITGGWSSSKTNGKGVAPGEQYTFDIEDGSGTVKTVPGLVLDGNINRAEAFAVRASYSQTASRR